MEAVLNDLQGKCEYLRQKKEKTCRGKSKITPKRGEKDDRSTTVKKIQKEVEQLPADWTAAKKVRRVLDSQKKDRPNKVQGKSQGKKRTNGPPQERTEG